MTPAQEETAWPGGPCDHGLGVSANRKLPESERHGRQKTNANLAYVRSSRACQATAGHPPYAGHAAGCGRSA